MAKFIYRGQTVSTNSSEDVHQIRSQSNATVVIRDRVFNNFVNFEGICAHLYHYLFLSYGEQCIVCGQILNTCNKHVVFGISIAYISTCAYLHMHILSHVS